MQRPPHSLAIFNLDDVKQINECVQEGFYRFYNWYLYALTKKDMLVLTTEKVFTIDEPHQERLDNGKLVPAREIEDLKQFFSEGELEKIEKENEYMLRGPGRIERIMREETEKLALYMEERIKKQDEEFLAKANPPKK